MNEAEKLGMEIGARIKALKEAAAKAAEKPATGQERQGPPTINVAAPAVTVTVPDAAPPTINVEPVIQVSAEMPEGLPPTINVAAPDLGPITEILAMMAQMIAANTAAVTELAKAGMAEKRLIIEDGKPVGVRAIAPSVH